MNKDNEKFNYIKCYSLNGLKFTELITEKKIINFFIEENLLVAYEDNLFEAFHLYEIDGDPIYQFEPNKRNDAIKISEDREDNKSNEELVKSKNKKLINCFLKNLEKKLILIYEDQSILIEDLSGIILKE